MYSRERKTLFALWVALLLCMVTVMGCKEKLTKVATRREKQGQVLGAGGPSSRALPPSPVAERPAPLRERERSPAGRTDRERAAERRRLRDTANERPRNTIRSQVDTCTSPPNHWKSLRIRHVCPMMVSRCRVITRSSSCRVTGSAKCLCKSASSCPALSSVPRSDVLAFYLSHVRCLACQFTLF